jgi:hypothetical protein
MRGCWANGDMQGRLIWKRIVAVILELLKDRPQKAEPVN